MACSSSGGRRDSSGADSTHTPAPVEAAPESASVSPTTQAPSGRPSPATTPAASSGGTSGAATGARAGASVGGAVKRKPGASAGMDTPTHAGPGPEVSAPAPGVQPAPRATVPAFIVFRDSVGAGDLAWLRQEGFTIEQVNRSTHSVSLRMATDYTGNPTKNPRVLRFNVAMR
ncbi:MAG TPA: hypothetical protein VF761_19320 [Gemmatimonadaceae bacterium]